MGHGVRSLVCPSFPRRTSLNRRGRLAGPSSLADHATGRFSSSGRVGRVVVLKKRVCHGCNIVKVHWLERPLRRSARSLSPESNATMTDCEVRLEYVLTLGKQVGGRAIFEWG